MILRPVAPPVEYGITKRLARAGNAAIALLRPLGSSAHAWLPGANGTTVASLPSNNYLLSDGNTGYSTVDGVDGLDLDGMGSLGSELGTPFDGTYTANTGVVCSGGVLTATAAAAGFMAFRDGTAVSVGKTYLVTGSYSTSSAFMVYLGGTTGAVVQAGSGTFSQYIVAAATSRFLINANNTLTGTINNISVKEYTGTHLTQPTTANKPLVRRGMLNLLTYSNTPTNASWAKTGSTAAPNETTINFPVELEPILNGASVTAPAGSTWTSAFVLSGTGTINIYCARHIGGGYEETASQVALTSTPTLYAVTHTLAGVQTAMRSGITRKTGDTATSVTFGGGGLFKGTWTAAQILAEGGIPTTTTTAASNPSAGKYWWSFDGSNDSLLSGNLGITTACTIVIAGRVNSLATSQKLFAEDTGGVAIYNEVTTGIVVFAKEGLVEILKSPSGTIVAGVPFVLTCRLSGGVFTIRKNGAQIATVAAGNTFVATTGARIGTGFNGTGAPLGGAIGWVVPIAAALSDAECLTVERLVSSQFPNGPVF